MGIKKKSEKIGRNLYKNNAEFYEPTYRDNKAYRAEDVLNAEVTVNNITFDADEGSMDRLDRVIDLANWKFNQAVAAGQTYADAYTAVYQNTMVGWKSADNTFVNVSVETLAQVQEAAMNQLSVIWQQYG